MVRGVAVKHAQFLRRREDIFVLLFITFIIELVDGDR